MTVACADCGTLQDLPPLPPRRRSICPICRRHLELTSGRSVTAGLACALGTLVLLIPGTMAPFMSVATLGMQRSIWMGSGVVELWHEHWTVLAVLLGLLAIVFPLVRFALLSLVLGAIRIGRRPFWLGPAFRWAVSLDVWAMPDVFLVAAFVGYSRVSVNLGVIIDWGGYCFIAAALLSMLSRASLDRRRIWSAIADDRPLPDGSAVLSCTTCDLLMPVEADGKPCPRCGARLVTRKRDGIIRTAALVIAAFVLYWPANIYPMSISIQMGNRVPYRIIDGIRALFEVGLAPLGVLVFCTSIAIPVVKILGLGWCVASAKLRSRKHLVLKTHLYRAIDELGRWSNVDPFIIAVLVPLMQFGALGSAHAASGATAFISVVVLTLMASRLFDPRLMWDAAQDSSQ